jgi:hypothetical protein
MQASWQLMTRALKTAGLALLGFAVLVIAGHVLLWTVWLNYD